MWFGDIGLKDDLPTFNLSFSLREYIKLFQKREWEIHVYLDVFSPPPPFICKILKHMASFTLGGS